MALKLQGVDDSRIMKIETNLVAQDFELKRVNLTHSEHPAR
jgi:hypothetical protein